jgi:uncharacterized membrane protein
MRLMGMGYIVFAVAFVALGVLSLGSGDFAFVWQPVPPDVPGRAILAYVSGGIMCVTGVGMLIRRFSAPASFIFTAYALIWLLVLHVPHLILGPMHEINWGACAEIATLVAGGWILYARVATPSDALYVAPLASAKAVRAAQLIFALSVPLIGLEHLVYAKDTADYVPAWLPYRMGWACVTGVAHIAAGFAIAFAVLPRLAAALEALMMGIFTVLVWIPAAIAAPAQRFGWTAFFISTALTAAAWIVAESYRDVSWFPSERSKRDLRASNRLSTSTLGDD